MKVMLPFCLLLLTIRIGAQPAPSIGNKGAITSVRLIAQTHNELTSRSRPRGMDSVTFLYSGNHNSKFDNRLLTYLRNYYVPQGEILPFINTTLMPTVLDLSDSLNIAYDSATVYRREPPKDSMQLKFSCARMYDALDNTIASSVYFYSDTLIPNGMLLRYKQVIAYSGTNLKTAYHIQYLGFPDTTQIRLTYYNAMGKPVLDSVVDEFFVGTFKHGPSFARRYTYNSVGQVLTYERQQINATNGSVISGMRYTYSYLSSGQLATILLETASPYWSSFKPVAFAAYSYTPSVAFPTSIRYKDLDTLGNPTGHFLRLEFHLNTFQQCDTFRSIDSLNGSVTIPLLSALTYNAGGYPVSKYDYDANSLPNVLVDSEHYYYQTYTVGVTPILGACTYNIFTYPNPTTGRITINHPDLKSVTPITISITNTAGQMVHAESLTPQGTKTEMLLGDEAPPGIYNIRISSTGSATLYSGTILKL